ncbi:MAG: putative phosphoribosyl transferase [Chlamydiales bacterium]|nr:putative phosphoribosyl transferase [Chlamydiales bacterium]MCH9635890.1 putative phosphoribosyl transferase [Chlamydiales bacterium]
MKKAIETRSVLVLVDSVELEGELSLPEGAKAVVLFSHGGGSSHRNPQNQHVAKRLNEAGFGTLLFDLLTKEEDKEDSLTRELRFNIPLLSHRLMGATNWLKKEELPSAKIAYFGVGTGAAAALIAASELEGIKAVICRGARCDLAGQALERVKVPTLLLVGDQDFGTIEINEKGLDQLECAKRFELVAGADYQFEGIAALDEVAALASNWMQQYF